MKKVLMNMDTDLVARVDEYARSMNINRTSAVCVLLNNALEHSKTLKFIDTLPAIMAEIQGFTKEVR